MDCDFPLLEYSPNQTPRQWGLEHGEAYRAAIQELVQLRTALMHEKNRALTPLHIERLAAEQWDVTLAYDADISEELIGIAEGANISLTDLVVLNNYTDFRDIQLQDQGCSVAFVHGNEGPIFGQTWDMHGSAKRFLCVLRIPIPRSEKFLLVYSLVGCVGLMGFSTASTVVGISNIYTDGAVPGVLWPAVIRKLLLQADLDSMTSTLTTAPVASGHNYLLAHQSAAQMWEVAPGLSELVSQILPGETGFIYHTNHCHGPLMIQRQTPIAPASTTYIRFDLLAKKCPHVQSLSDMTSVMTDHENYPRGICSRYPSESIDPSMTCGGVAGNLETGIVAMWRGDPNCDENYRRRDFHLKT